VFDCGESYSNLGTQAAIVTPTDFRFYVSDVALIDAMVKALIRPTISAFTKLLINHLIWGNSKHLLCEILL
jgi:hypothetical protein